MLSKCLRKPVRAVITTAIFLTLILQMLVPGMSQQHYLYAQNNDDQHEENQHDETPGIQEFLDQQPGVLKSYEEDDQLAAAIIEGYSFYYGVNPYLHLILLETINSLVSNPQPSHIALHQPYSPDGPDGFTAQIEWASREIRAGFGPYEQPPVLRFTDGLTTSLTLDQAPEGVAIQRFLAIGRTFAEWKTLNDRFAQLFDDYFASELPNLTPDLPVDKPLAKPGEGGFLQCPWPIGMRVVHLAYFDHAYPTVDIGGDSNDVVVTYVGSASVQYNTHDGHDYFFPDVPVGTPILAAAPGLAYASTARGNGVYILHANGYETVYWHLNHFAPKFRSIVNTGRGVWVEAGEVLGTSGTSGFSYGTPHLHFEVRHRGRQVDPYGWYGDGPDPCEEYAGCVNHGWLWDSSLYGLYDFTPPDLQGASAGNTTSVTPDVSPPVGTLSINPPNDLRFLAHYDGHLLQQVGNGFPETEGVYTFSEGRYGRALNLPEGSGLTYPTADNINLAKGTISLWANLPAEYPPSIIDRHYILAASANPQDETYPGTFALRRDLLGPEGAPRWNFWTTPLHGEDGRDDLAVPDTLQPGWHHMAISWDSSRGSKVLYLDGVRVAAHEGVRLPEDIGDVLQIGRFTYDGNQSGIMLDDLAIYERVLKPIEIAAIAESQEPINGNTLLLNDTRVFLDTNAQDEQGIIVAVQIGQNGVFGDPQPYYDAFRWDLPTVEGMHTLSVRYFDRASNRRVVSQTVTLDLPPRGDAELASSTDLTATLAISATDIHQPVEMQISQYEDFERAQWEPVRETIRWIWYPDTLQSGPPTLYVRFRDAGGLLSDSITLSPYQQQVLPIILK